MAVAASPEPLVDAGPAPEPAERDERAVDEAAAETRRETGEDGHGQRHVALEEAGEHHAGKGDERADREVNAPADDDEGQPDGDDRVDRSLLRDVEQVRDREEMRREDQQDDAQAHQARERPELPRVVRDKRGPGGAR